MVRNFTHYAHFGEQEFIRSFNQKVCVAVGLLSHIREVLYSNLGRDIAYPNCGFSLFSALPLGRCRDSTSNMPRPLLPNPFDFIIRLLFYNSASYSLGAGCVVK
jgi:hypothetical protein